VSIMLRKIFASSMSGLTVSAAGSTPLSAQHLVCPRSEFVIRVSSANAPGKRI